MKKILQKSLASMVSAALCLTAFVGCLTVSATTGTGAFTVNSQKANPGKSVTVPVVITSDTDSKGLAAAIFDLTFDPAVLTPTAIAAPSGVTTYGIDYRTSNGDLIDVKTDAVTGNGTIRVLASLKDNQAKPVESMTANITFDVSATATIADTAITITNAQACNYGKVDVNGLIYDADTDLIAMTALGGVVTVTNDPVGPVEVALGCSHTLSLGNSIAITYSFRNKDVVAGVSVSEYCARVYAKITKEHYADDGDLSMETTIDCTLDSASGMYTFKYKGLAAKEMTKTVTARIYGEDADGNVIMISKTPDVYGVLNYATSSVGFSGTDGNLKTCLADILNYGAAAQVFFGYNTSDLVNARDSVSSYVTEFSTVNDVVWTDNQEVTGNESFQVSPGFSLNSSIDMYVNVNPARLSSYDLSTIKVVFSFHNSKENKDYNIEVPYGDVDNFSGGSVYSFYCRELAAAQVSEDVYVAVYSGDQKISKTTKYSVETYCARLTSNSTDQSFIDLCQSIMKYGNSAKIVLGY